MVLILGQDDNQWIGKIISVQEDDKTVSVYFFKEHPRWPGGKRALDGKSRLGSTKYFVTLQLKLFNHI